MIFYTANQKTLYLVEVDLPMVLSATARSRKRYPKFPVETGFSLTDTAIPEAKQGTFRVLAPHGGAANRARQAYEALQKLQDADELVSIRTPVLAWDRMAIGALDITHDKDTGKDLYCSVSMEEIRQGSLAQVATVPGRDPSVPAIPGGMVHPELQELATPTVVTVPMKAIPVDDALDREESSYWRYVFGGA